MDFLRSLGLNGNNNNKIVYSRSVYICSCLLLFSS